jgi:hypothetical protein
LAFPGKATATDYGGDAEKGEKINTENTEKNRSTQRKMGELLDLA